MMNGYERLSPIGYGKSRLSSAYRLERGGESKKGGTEEVSEYHIHIWRGRGFRGPP